MAPTAEPHGSRPIGCKQPSVIANSSRTLNTPLNASPEHANSCLCDAEMAVAHGHGWGGVPVAAPKLTGMASYSAPQPSTLLT